MALAHQCRKGHVLQRRKRGQQMVELKNETQRAAPTPRQLGILQVLHRFALQPVTARRGVLQQTQNIQQRALA